MMRVVAYGCALLLAILSNARAFGADVGGVAAPTWAERLERWASGPLASPTLLVIVLVSLLLVALAREVRKFGLDPRDPTVLHVGFGRYVLYTRTGVIVGASKERQVQTFVSGGGAQTIGSQVHVDPVVTRHVETLHDRFFIDDPQHGETDFHVTHMDLALRPGHVFSTVWGIKPRRKQGPYLAFRNHTLGRLDFPVQTLREVLRPLRWPIVPFALLMQGFKPGWAGLLWGCAGFYLVYWLLREARVRHFRGRGIGPLVQMLDERAANGATVKR